MYLAHRRHEYEVRDPQFFIRQAVLCRPCDISLLYLEGHAARRSPWICPEHVLICFLWHSQQTATLAIVLLEWVVYCAVRTVCKHTCVSEDVTFMVLLSEGQAGESLELRNKVRLFEKKNNRVFACFRGLCISHVAAGKLINTREIMRTHTVEWEMWIYRAKAVFLRAPYPLNGAV